MAARIGQDETIAREDEPGPQDAPSETAAALIDVLDDAVHCLGIAGREAMIEIGQDRLAPAVELRDDAGDDGESDGADVAAKKLVTAVIDAKTPARASKTAFRSCRIAIVLDERVFANDPRRIAS